MAKKTPKSKAYFELRAEKRIHKAHEDASVAMARVNRAYDRSMQRLNADLERIFGKFGDLSEEEARKLLQSQMSNEEYERTLAAFHSAKDPEVRRQMKQLLKVEASRERIRRIEAMKSSIAREKLLMTDTQLTETKKHLSKVYTDARSGMGFSGVDKKRVEQVLKEDWSGEPWSKRIWKNQEALADDLQGQLIESFSSGKTNRQIAKELEEHTDMGRHVCNRLIRTETSFVVNQADLDDAISRGITKRRFVANLDMRTSEKCRDHNGTIVDVKDTKIGVNTPPLHPYCRSFMVEILEGWDDVEDDEE